ncbi:hypothetical protein PMAYCL1PPCAC_19778 [Pristionchus mayeri]|uniref:UDP-glucuronosyltransferase n=1 Tax=Pristionchus mayeri TaxID=1317129 RepID=A0AAN5CS18_9BILA|nr:hypothetical protein PMAYCL1PPCAC_19778 [Pristionchus mayeri]
MAGIEKTAWANSFATCEFANSITQMPSAPSYVPSLFSPFGDRMTFGERLMNTFYSYVWGHILTVRIDWMQPIFKENLYESVANNSLVLLNSEPLLDYPRPTVHRVIDIGGIVISDGHEQVDEYWSEVLSRRKRTVILSFGTFFQETTMPEAYKATIRRSLSAFDDVTFIWKYENPEENVSQGIENIVEATWIPQVALLNDARLTAFITHGGQGSTLEAAYAGVPILMVPTQGDQMRNAAMIKRAGLGDIVLLNELENGNRLEEAIRELLENEERMEKAKQMAAMLRDRPFSAKENLVRNMEFLAKYGPLRMLDHEGTKLNFIQYYLIDVFFFFGFVMAQIMALICYCCFASCRLCCRRLGRKSKTVKRE